MHIKDLHENSHRSVFYTCLKLETTLVGRLWHSLTTGYYMPLKRNKLCYR